MSGLALSLILQATFAAGGASPYETAYQQTQANGQPLLVLVGADWCPGCRTMKHGVLARMQQGGRLKSVNFATVNTDQSGALPGQLMRGNTIPQLIVFVKTGSGWHREQITGAVSEAAVEALLKRALDAQAAALVQDRDAGGSTGR